MNQHEPQTNGDETPADAAAEGAAPSKPATRRARSKPASAPQPEEGIPPQGAPSAAPQEEPSPAPAPQASLYGDGSNEEVPIGGATNSLYDAELEVRHSADQAEGQQAFLGNLAAGVLQLIGDNLRRMTEEQAEKVNALLRGIDLKDYLDPDFWRGIGMVLQYQIDEQVSFVKRRISGDYTTDPYGMDRELIEVARPFLNFMYRTWWRISAEGLEHVPAEGRGLLVGNHSGVLPWDGAMIAVAVGEEHPAQNQRIVRSLYLHWFSSLPFVAPAIAALGNVPGLPENAVRLLEDDELVCVFPEGVKGVGKLFKDRYQLARFGRGGFVQAAIRAQAPIIPVAVVGAEEIYPMLANATPIARLLGMPFFPITPFFPWLGPAGIIPLPTRWSITFCEPLPTDMYDPSEADDPITVLGLSEIVRNTIQTTLDARLAQHRSVF
ncbi:glycerol acyltransferase [Candidatus Viridilinea mediisalina]|uniref:Glycerol acyltransferase n=2 Tax=Candidatus Viridilinea mediisalina TaxID=2024553 RepID=A0A2A6RDY1_9CHLR|nr:glycerol acyltransferase [Candidatus Viridilinea mediisalina]